MLAVTKKSRRKEIVNGSCGSLQRTGAEVLLDALVQEGVNTVFGYPGGAIIPVYDALVQYRDQIGHVLVRHEQGAIHAAQGYARVSGKTGVVFATSGPGATNLVTGLADALMDSTPVVCITGQVYAHLLGTDAFQEADIIGITLPCTKWNYQVRDARQLSDVLAKAFHIAKSGRPGPVLIDITKDAQLQLVRQKNYQSVPVANHGGLPVVGTNAIRNAAQLINTAHKPLVLFGQGVLLGKAENELKAFIEKGGLPAAATLLGLGALPTCHPLYMGMLGMHGNYAPNVLTNECDLLIAVGMRFDDRVTGKLDCYAKQAKIIHLDIDPSEIDKNVKATVAVIGDCKQTLSLISEQLVERHHPEWVHQFTELELEERAACVAKDLFPESDELTMGEVIRSLNEITGGNAVIVTDVGQHQMVASRYARFAQSRSNITSGGSGTMGFALPAAIGAKYGAPERPVVAIVGDGGFQMTLQELGTIMQTGVNVKIIILNNRFLGMVRQWQELFNHKRYSEVEIESPDFVQLANAYRIRARRVENREELKHSLTKMMEHKGSYLLEVMVCREANVFPMVEQGKSVSEIRLK